VSARAIARRIEIDADAVVAVGIHNERIASYFRVPFRHVSGAPALADYLSKVGLDLVLAPDVNASALARCVASAAGRPWDFLEKARIDSWTVETKAKELDVKGRRVAIVDDVISTGATIANAARILKEQQAREVLAACIHGVFVQGSMDRLGVCDEVIATDTLANPVAKVSVAPQVAAALGVKD
jgi:ribose-phosphate pyrophosphokinase